ncbi:universal stress protein [Kitasatospora sp. NBC_00085]|uniref:universal stress protein n=1 Tax=unclassified Kitasatospora TaxID=2633591 RepID=UPI002F91544D
MIRGPAGPALVAATGPDDLLVVGSSGHSRLDHLLHGCVTRHCRTHAPCAVIAVSPSALLEKLELTARSGAPSRSPHLAEALPHPPAGRASRLGGGQRAAVPARARPSGRTDDGAREPGATGSAQASRLLPIQREMKTIAET